MERIAGEQAAAYDLANASVHQLEQLSFDAGDAAAQTRDDALQNALGLVSEAALRLGRYGEAEAAARRRMAMPPISGSFGNDPLKDMFQRRVLLAHAIAKNGRGAEAQTVLAPALEYYGREKKAGAIGTDFRLAYAEALYVSALAQGTDPAGRATRELSGWIAAALASTNS